ncbi:MAG: C2 family cysteine protease [bacterium]
MDRTGEMGLERPGAGGAAWARELVAAVGGVDHPLAQVPLVGLPAVVGGLAAWAQSAEWRRALEVEASDGMTGGGIAGDGMTGNGIAGNDIAGDDIANNGIANNGITDAGTTAANGAADGIADFNPAWQTEGAHGAGGEPPLDPARARPTPWSSQVRRHFDDWAGVDGFLADDEINALMRDPRVVGDAAAALAVVHARADEIAALSDDEWGLEDDGVTLADLAAYEERAGNGRGAGFDGIYRGFAERLRATPAAVFAQPDGRVDATAARQGAITDCWLIAAVVGRAAAAPESVAEMISEDPDGRLTVRFPGAGAVTIDRPTDAEVARYSTAGRDGRWLAALEKAYARHRSGADAADPYAAIDSPSLASTGIAPLSTGGTDHDLLGFTRRSVTRAKLTAALSARRIVTASVKMPNALGLPIGHIYTVMAFDGATVTVRNPWGEGGGRRDVDRDGIVTLSLAEFDDVFFDITYETGAPAAAAGESR